MQINDFTIIIGFLCGVFLFYQLPRLKRSKRNEQEIISVSVIIPARNEEKNLPNILSDLANQTYSIHEVICVDDNSEDRTANVIDEFGAICVELKSLPKGWKGKTWACQNGATKATGQLLLFIDADVRLSNDAIERLVNRYIKHRSPISIQPYHTVKKPHEFLSLIFNMIQLCSTSISCFGSRKNVGLYGPLFMIPKKLFDQHGGFKVVKGDVIEDFNLGKYYSKQDIDIDLLLGGDSVTYRMYPMSVWQVVEGWSKNFASAAVTLNGWLLMAIIMWLAYLTVLPYELIKTVIAGQGLMTLVLSLLYMLNTFMLCRICKAMGSYPVVTCLFYPFYLAVFHLVFAYSVFATFIFKSTTWKGRQL